jgi:hypothetical protein
VRSYVFTNLCGQSCGDGRSIPDVAANANIASGYSGIVLGGAPSPFPGNGTSASAPQWAGLIAVINAALGVRVGHVNPALYQLAGRGFRAKAFASGPSDNSNNGAPGYSAGAAWDACTGWGSPDGQALLAALQPIYTNPSVAADHAVAARELGRRLSGGVIEIELGGGIRVRVDARVDEQALSRVLRAVKGTS